MDEREQPLPKKPHLLTQHITTTAADIPHDVWLVILNIVIFPPCYFPPLKDVRACKMVCKQWKEWMERLFDHSYDYYLPLVSNCENGNVEEVQRLLHILPIPSPSPPSPPLDDSDDDFLPTSSSGG